MSVQARWAANVVAGLVAGGVRDVVVSPGSRSTPFVLAALQRPELTLHDIIDERAAGFFALGLARVTGQPPLLLCTSGSAAAHYLPAVMEAGASNLPLVVLSADRPAELHDLGVNQTTDQLRLFGSHVRAFFELGSAHQSERAMAGASRRAHIAVTRSVHPTPGPVHLNVRARKPLESAERVSDDSPRVFFPRAEPDASGVRWLAEQIAAAKRPLFIAGPAPMSASHTREAVARLVAQTGAPLIADATSQLRFSGTAMAIPQGALALRVPAGRARLDADLVVQLGAAPIDRGFEEWARGRRRIVVARHRWSDPMADVEAVILGDIGATIGALVSLLPTRPRWSDLPSLEAAPMTLGPGAVAREVAAHVPSQSILMLGNSLAARTTDLFAAQDRDLTVLHQRGLSGIDGLVAGAAGAAVGSGRRVTLLLGDVSLLHDLGGLMTTRRVKTPLRIVVVNDDGGRIFEQLPVHDRLPPPEFEDHFSMAHGLTFEAAAKLYGLDYQHISELGELKQALGGEGRRLIEVPADPGAGRRELEDAIASAERQWA